MKTNLERFKNELHSLLYQGDAMNFDIANRHRQTKKILQNKNTKRVFRIVRDKFEEDYQSWFTASAVLVKTFIPDRLKEFNDCYAGSVRRKNMACLNYTIQDWLMGVHTEPDPGSTDEPVDERAAVIVRFEMQMLILAAVETALETSLHGFRSALQVDLLRSCLETARLLVRTGQGRAASGMAGVALERHLALVAEKYDLAPRKAPGAHASDWAQALKERELIDMPAWRGLQHLDELRQTCLAGDAAEPAPAQVNELIDGVEKVLRLIG